MTQPGPGPDVVAFLYGGCYKKDPQMAQFGSCPDGGISAWSPIKNRAQIGSAWAWPKWWRVCLEGPINKGFKMAQTGAGPDGGVSVWRFLKKPKLD